MPQTSVAGLTWPPRTCSGAMYCFRTGAPAYPARRAGDAEVQDLRHPALGDDVRRLEVEVQDTVAVEVVDGRAKVQPEVCNIAYRQPPVGGVDEICQCLPGKRLQDKERVWFLDGLVEAHDVRVRELLEEPALAQKAAPNVLVVQQVLTGHLGDAAAGPFVAEGVVDVEVIALVEVLYHLVPRRKDVAGSQRRVVHTALVVVVSRIRLRSLFGDLGGDAGSVEFVEAGVEPVVPEQVGVGAAFGHAPVFEDQDLRRLAYGGEVVGDHDRRAARS